MKKQYDVWLMNQVKGGIQGDFEMIDTITATDYRNAVRIAKEKSIEWDACNIICETWDSDGDYYILWKERYEHGMKQWRKLVENI